MGVRVKNQIAGKSIDDKEIIVLKKKYIENSK